MKKLLLITGFALSTCFSFGQYWTKVGAPFRYSLCGCTFSMSALEVYNGKLYAGGFVSNGVESVIASWDGTKWDSLGSGVNPADFGSVASLLVYKGKLIVGGFFVGAGNGAAVNSIAAWNGSSWSALGSGVRADGYSGTINAMTVFNGNLYVGGSFDSAGGIPVNSIAMWNGTSWSDVGGGINKYQNSTFYAINSMTVYNGNLYVGGNFDTAGGKPAYNVAEWNGSSWISLGNGIHNGMLSISSETENYSVNALCSYKNNLYAGGLFDSAGNVPANNIAVWNGSAWSPLGKGMGGWSSDVFYGVYSLYDIDSALIVGGTFNLADSTPANSVAEWNGSTWMPFGSGVSDDPFSSISGGDSLPSVYATIMYNNNLYVAGQFDSAGNAFTGCVAEWDGPVSINQLSKPGDAITVYPNPSNGIFNLQLGITNYESKGIEIYNMLGEKVASSNSSEGGGINSLPSGGKGWAIDLSNQPAGVYLYRVTDRDGKCIGSGKLIKE